MTGLTCLGEVTRVQVLIQHTLEETCSEYDPVCLIFKTSASRIWRRRKVATPDKDQYIYTALDMIEVWEFWSLHSHTKEFWNAGPYTHHEGIFVWSVGVAPVILRLGNRRRWIISLNPRLLYPGIQPPVSTKYEAGWAPEQIRIVWRRDNFFATSGIRNPDNEHRTPVSILTTLFLLVLTTYAEFINVRLQ